MSKQTYLMKSNNKYKIGMSDSPLSRLKTLKIGNPNIAIVLCCEKDKVSEKVLHRMFKHRRIEGEWFNLTKSDIEICKNLMGKKLPRQAEGKVSCTFHLRESTRKMLQEKSFRLHVAQSKLIEDAILKLCLNKETEDELNK